MYRVEAARLSMMLRRRPRKNREASRIRKSNPGERVIDCDPLQVNGGGAREREHLTPKRVVWFC